MSAVASLRPEGRVALVRRGRRSNASSSRKLRKRSSNERGGRVSDVVTGTLAQVAAALRAKQLSSVELTRAVLARVDAAQGALNAFVTVDAEGALAQARAADAALAKGDAPPLAGVPIAHKDVIMTAGLPTTCGSRMLANFTAPYDAFVVEGLRNAGTVLIGKTNMDEFAMGSSNETSYFGTVKNPWNTEYVPGGSSGGSAAAVAARLVPGTTGTDTGGSIRQPASLSGICGMKPTYGVCSRYGLDRVRVEPRHAGHVRAHRGGLRAHAERDGGPRRARFHVARPAARGLHAAT